MVGITAERTGISIDDDMIFLGSLPGRKEKAKAESHYSDEVTSNGIL